MTGITKCLNILLVGAVALSGIAIAQQGGNEPAVTVNGEAVPEAQVQQMLQPQLQQIAAQQQDLPQEFIEQYKMQIRQQILEQLIAQKLLEQEAQKQGLEASRDDAIAHLEMIGNQQQPAMSLDDIREVITASGQQFDEVVTEIQQQLGPQMLIEQQVEGKVDISQEEAEAYYEQNQAEFSTPEQVRARHILIDNENPEAQTLAQELKEQVTQGDADFEQLAAEHSACPSGQQGGDLGFFSRGQMVPEFEEKAFELEPGQVGDVVETQFGYHIIKVEEKSEPSVLSFEEAQPQIHEMLGQQQRAEIAQTYIEELRESAEIEYPQGQEPPEQPEQPGMPMF